MTDMVVDKRVVPVVLEGGYPSCVSGDMGAGGWSWGSIGRSGQWMTIPGSANTTPKLGRTPGTAYRLGPDSINEACAYVVPTFVAGVTVTQTGFKVVRRAQLRAFTLEVALIFEDAEYDAGLLAGDDRETCPLCRAWATDEHMDGEQHWSLMRPDAVAEYHSQMADLTRVLNGLRSM